MMSKPPSPNELYQQSMALINQAIQTCGIEGFDTTPLSIPQVIDEQPFNPQQMPQPNQNAFYTLAQQVFNEQGAIFGDQGEVFNQQDQMYQEPEAQPTQAQGATMPPNSGATPAMPGVIPDAMSPQVTPAPPNPNAPAGSPEASPNNESLAAISNMLGLG